nr:glycosyltransferase [Periweissella ghanensis]
MEKISVIIPVYNGQKTIERAVNSVLDQTFQDFELLIIDNESTDKTLEILNNIKSDKIRILNCEKGRSKARNLGINSAKGDFIAFLDADDMFEKNHLKMSMKAFELDGTLDLFADQAVHVKANKKIGNVTSFEDKKSTDLLKGNLFCISSPVFKNDKNIILFNEELEYNEDWLFWTLNFFNKNIQFSEYVGSLIFITGENTMSKIEMYATMAFVLANFKKELHAKNSNFSLIIKSVIWLRILNNETLNFTKSIIKQQFPIAYAVGNCLAIFPFVKKEMMHRRESKKNIY